MIKILFVCHGNICRSPMAEYVLRHMVNERGYKEEFQIASAATSNEEIGHDVHDGTKQELAKHHIPCPIRHARKIRKEDYIFYDYIIGMDSQNISNIKNICGEDKNHKIMRLLDFSDHPKDIGDPWYTGNFSSTYQDVLTGCEGLLCFLQKYE